MLESYMPNRRIPSKNDRGQHGRFIEAGRELECDDDKEWFEGRLKKIAKAKPDQSFAKPR
jgi:hypothetical protein